MKSPLLGFCLLFLLLVRPGLGQTAAWLPPGHNVPAASWNTAANWDTGTVPNDPAATAVLRTYFSGILFNLNATTLPGTAPVTIDQNAAITVGEIRYQLDGSRTSQTGPGITLGSVQTSPVNNSSLGHLRLAGAGFTSANSTDAHFSFPTVIVLNGSLEFANQATAGGIRLSIYDQVSSAITTHAGAIFRDASTAGSADIHVGGTLGFYDQSSAAQSSISLQSSGSDGSASLGFSGQAAAGSARISIGDYSVVSFGDSASAQNATITSRSSVGYTQGRNHSLGFYGQATAGQATVTATTTALPVTFRHQASADQSSLTLGTGSSLTFHDASTAAQARVTGNASIGFRNNSTAAQAIITGDHIVFQDQASAGTAQLSPTFNIALSSVEFRDHSTAGNATINLGKLGDVLFTDDADASTATVSIGSGASAARVIIEGNARTAGLSITTAQGGHGRLDITGGAGEIELRTLNGLNDITLGANSLRFTAATGGGASTIAGSITGSGGLTWDRTATLTIAHPDNTFTGVTRVLRGTLNLASGRVAAAEISGPAALTGSGRIAGRLDNAGSLRPGNSAGTIQVDGDYLQAATGTLHIELMSATEYDRLIVGGTATLGGTLNLSFPTGFVPVGSAAFDFLTAGAVTGQFAAVQAPTGASAALSSQLQYTATGVRVAVTQRSFAGFGITPAATALGAHLDATLGSATGDYRLLLTGLNALTTTAEVGAALDALAPDRYSVLAENAFAAATARQAALDRRLATFRSTQPAARGLELFFAAGQRRADYEATGGLPAARSKTSAGTVGGTWRHAAFSLGSSLTQENGDLDLDPLGSRAELKSLAPAVFFQYAPDRFFVHAAVVFSRDDYDLRRRIAYSGVDQIALAAPSGRRTDLAVTTGYAIPTDAWTFTSRAGVLASTLRLDEFTETGAGAAGLTMARSSLRSIRTHAGFDASYRTANGRTIPRLSITWLHELQTDRAFQVRLGGAGYTAAGQEAEKDLVQASLSFERRLGRRASFHAALGGAWGRNYSVTSDFSAGLRWEF